MKHSDRKRKRMQWLAPIIVFVLGCIILAIVLYSTGTANQKQLRTITELNAMTYAERMTSDLNDGITITDALKEILVSENGKIANFSLIAEDMMTSAIQSIQLAPDGVVTEIYPEAGNEAGKIDLLQDEERGEICRYGRDHDLTIMQGPFSLK